MYKHNIHRVGAINETKAQLYFLQIGYDVFIPALPKTRADFIISKGEEVSRVQVKTAQYNGPYIQSRLDVNNKRYTKEDCDLLVFILDGMMWIAPIDDVANLSSVCLGKVNDDKYKPFKPYDPKKWRVA